MSKALLLDLVERTVATFIQAALAVVVVQQSLNVDVLKVALVAGGLAVAKFALMKANLFLGSSPS